jgi:uncharacterized protein
MRLLAIALATGVIVYLALCGLMYFSQRRLTYFPDTTRVAPGDKGLDGVTEITMATPDGEKVLAWYGKAKPGQPTLLYFHGNGGSLATRVERIRKHIGLGRGLFMMSYRGYSGSTGEPSEAANVADAKLAYDTLVKSGVAPKDIIIYGESIGSGVAVQVAAEKLALALVLDAPYTRLVDIAAERYPWVPVRLMMRDQYDSASRLAGMKLPLLVIHGDLDQTIPVAMGAKVYELAGGPKDIVILKGAGHNDHHLFGSFEAVNAWIDRLRAGPVR